MRKIHVIHENATWSEPLFAALQARGLPYEDWFLDEGVLRLDQAPPEGVFYNRMSASSHTRDHRYAPERTAATLMWLEAHGRRVLNNSRALSLELSKAAQYAELERHGVKTPQTLVAVGRAAILEAGKALWDATGGAPLIVKPNRAGKGAGVQLFRALDALEAYLESGVDSEADGGAPVDGITLVQRYIQAPAPFITRVEFVGQRFLYAVRVDTSEGFELCPADACAVEDAFCPVGEEAGAEAAEGDEGAAAAPASAGELAAPRPKFEIIKGFDHPLPERYQAFMKANGAHITAFEQIIGEDGATYTYDVNMNTNYNSDAEAVAGMSGMGAIADYLGRELAELG